MTVRPTPLPGTPQKSPPGPARFRAVRLGQANLRSKQSKQSKKTESHADYTLRLSHSPPRPNAAAAIVRIWSSEVIPSIRTHTHGTTGGGLSGAGVPGGGGLSGGLLGEGGASGGEGGAAGGAMYW